MNDDNERDFTGWDYVLAACIGLFLLGTAMLILPDSNTPPPPSHRMEGQP